MSTCGSRADARRGLLQVELYVVTELHDHDLKRSFSFTAGYDYTCPSRPPARLARVEGGGGGGPVREVGAKAKNQVVFSSSSISISALYDVNLVNVRYQQSDRPTGSEVGFITTRTDCRVAR
jgi:hypothetical protein